MAKFYGAIGFSESVETEPGIWEEKVVDKFYYGDIIKKSRRLQSSGNVIDNITLSNQISIVADPYASHKCCDIRYVEYMDVKWKVTDVENQFPRLILTLGGVYSVETLGTSE